MERKVVFVGLDGVSWEILESLFDHHVMSNLSFMVKRGASGVVKSFPPSTLPGWTTLTTGVNPGKHGIFDFVTFDLYDYGLEINNALNIMYPRIHDILSMNGRKSIVINLPPSWPPLLKNNGILVADWLSPKMFVHPKEAKKYAGDYVLVPRFTGGADGVENLVSSTEKRVIVAKRLFENFEWDFYFVMFSEPDQLLHRFYHNFIGKDALKTKRVFQCIDRFLGWLLKNKPDNTLIVVASDHGIGKSYWQLRVNIALAASGFARKTYISLNGPSKGERKFSLKIPRVILSLVNSSKIIQSISERLYTTLFRKLINLEQNISVDKRYSMAFMPQDYSYGIYVNEKLTNNVSLTVNHLKDLFLEMERKRKLRIFEVIEPREEFYWGPHLNKAPHLVLIPRNSLSLSNSVIGIEALPNFETVSHFIDGILLFYGDDVKRGFKFNKPRCLYDIAPTIFHYLNLPLPNKIDGIPLVNAFQNPKSTFTKIKYRNYLERYQIARTRARAFFYR